MVAHQGSAELLKQLLTLGTTPKLAAVRDMIRINDTEKVALLLEFGLNPNGESNFRPLHEAAILLNLECMDLLLQAGADANGHTSDGTTALQLALIAGTQEQLNNPDARLQRSLDVVKLLFRYNASVWEAHESGFLPIHFASTPEMLHLLQQHGNTVNVAAMHGIRPIHLAVRMHSLGYLQALIDAGADIEVLISFNPLLRIRPSDLVQAHQATALDYMAQDFDMHSPLLIAVRLNQPDTIRLLLRAGANLNGPNEMLPLHWAQSAEVYHLLRDAGASLHQIALNTCHLPLHQAAQSGPLEVVQLMLQDMQLESSADTWINSRSEHDETPLHLAAQYNTPEVVQALLNAGADVNLQDDSGWTSLMLCLQSSSPATVVQMLLEAGASCHFKNKDGSTVLHLAASIDYCLGC